MNNFVESKWLAYDIQFKLAQGTSRVYEIPNLELKHLISVGLCLTLLQDIQVSDFACSPSWSSRRWRDRWRIQGGPESSAQNGEITVKKKLVKHKNYRNN